MDQNKSNLPAEAIQLYNQFVHGDISRRDFMDGLQKFAVGGLTVAALSQMLMPNYAAAQQVSKSDERIKASYETVPSPQGNGSIKGYLVRPISADTRDEKPKQLPGIIVVHENRGLNPHIEDVARRFALEGFMAFAPDGTTSQGGFPGDDYKGGLAFAKVDKLADGGGGRSIDLAESEDEGLRIRGLTIKQHNGAVMLADADVHIAPGEKVLVKGESGTGKSTLIRAMAGLWPWGEGTVLRPKGARLAFLPQRPYIPVGTLMDALDYPTEDRPLDRVRAADMLSRCGLEHLVSRLDEADNWSNTLSGGEQQRIGFARVLLKKPDLIIMDEATSALDEASQTRMMQLLREEAPNSIVLHVAHRPGLEAWHDREIVLTRVGSGPATVETPEPGVLDAGKRWLRKIGRAHV